LRVSCAPLAIVRNVDEDARVGGTSWEGVSVESGSTGCGEFDADVVGLYSEYRYEWRLREKEGRTNKRTRFVEK
jgi:hypothetical protein